MARRRISKDLNPVQTHLNMWAKENKVLINSQVYSDNPSAALWCSNLLGFQSSAHISVPMQVSFVDRTQSPKGTIS